MGLMNDYRDFQGQVVGWMCLEAYKKEPRWPENGMIWIIVIQEKNE